MALAGAFAACERSSGPTGTQPQTPVQPTVSGALTVRIVIDNTGLVPGSSAHVSVQATSATGAHVSTDGAVLTSSNGSIINIENSVLVPMRDAQTGATWTERYATVRAYGSGTATVQATIGGATDTVRLNVQPLAGSAALVVDSFTVVEFRASCAWNCPYLVYAPQLTLREPTRTSTVQIVSVEFTLGKQTTGTCTPGSLSYGPGMSAELNGIYDYLWSNDLIFVSLDGTPLPDSIATARVVVRSGDGSVGSIFAAGPVQRMVKNPSFPAPLVGGWDCASSASFSAASTGAQSARAGK
jgi:hypothetical protein